MSINRVSISGNLTRDAELRETTNGKSVLNFSVAVNDRRQNARGEWEDVPNFVDCAAFGNRAQGLAQYLTKGTKVAVAGKLRQSRWQDQNGNNRSKLEVWLDDCEFMSRKQDDGGYQQQGGYQQGGYQQSNYQQGSYQQQPRRNAPQMYADEDIPF